jgi:hypothetical protein
MIRSAAEDKAHFNHNIQGRSTSPQLVLETSVATPSALQSSEDEAVELSEQPVDGSSMSCSNDNGAQKEEILDRLVFHFYRLFACTTFAQ